MPNWAELNEEETLKWLAKDTEPIRVISSIFFKKKWESVRVIFLLQSPFDHEFLRDPK